jgi:retron-type reverse transcriptase
MDEVIGKLHDKKCPGPDGIDGPIVKRIHSILPSFWVTLMNKCLRLGCFPKAWKTARVIAIPKTDKSKHHTVHGYRGISLLPIIGKCLESLVVERLKSFLETAGLIPPQQFGFTAGRSTVDAIKKVIKSVTRGRTLGTKCCLVALDIAGAFDNTWHPALLVKLREQKCPSNICLIIKYFLLNRKAFIRIGTLKAPSKSPRDVHRGQ